MTRHGDRAACANCGAEIEYRHPASHVDGFWLHVHEDGDYEPRRCRLVATPGRGYVGKWSPPVASRSGE